MIDEEAGAIIERAYAKAREILEEHKDKLDTLAERLLEREVIFKEDLVDILGPRTWEKSEPAKFKSDASEADVTAPETSESEVESNADAGSAASAATADTSAEAPQDGGDSDVQKGTAGDVADAADENAA